MVIATLAIGLIACQAASPSPSPSPTPSTSLGATVEPTATPRPISLPRPTDIPRDGTCESGHVCLGVLESGKSYATVDFEAPLTLTMPVGGWENLVDAGGIFQLLPIESPGDAIAFLLEPAAVGAGAATAGTSVDQLAAWLTANPLLDVTPAAPVTVGGLDGVRMDVRIAPGAQNQDPGCPVQVCVPFVRGSDPTPPIEWSWDWGSAGLETQRLYLVTSNEGVVAIFVDSFDGTSFDALTTAADQILATVKFN
jgi:hypothetical protein